MITIKHFTATWCQPCKQLSPIMRELSSQNPTVGYQIIDIDNNSQIAQQYGIRSVPTIVFERNSSIVQTVVGVQSKSYYQGIINSL